VAKATNPLLPKLPKPSRPSAFHPKRPFSIAPRGPKHLRLGQHPFRIGVGPGEPPPGFVGVWGSREEWLVYWAIATHKQDPKDPRVPPFTGSRVGTWVYQSPQSPSVTSQMGGRVPGGSVTDYQVQTPTGWIGIRLDTERWHVFAAPNQQLKDLFIKTHSRAVQKTVTLFSQDFVEDETGEAVMRVTALALRGIEMPNPIRFGTARRTRPRVVMPRIVAPE
jgi:hypothetical protein